MNIDSLVSSQSLLLKSLNAELQKQLVMNGAKEEKKYRPDSLAWRTELDILRQLTIINKPIYQDLYTQEDNQLDSESNLKIRSYSTTQDVPVPVIKFYYRNSFENLRRITSTYIEKNSLYKSERHFDLEFLEEGQSIRLEKFKVTGFQKMILSDSVVYSLQLSIFR